MSKKICPICGYQDDGNATYCRECGAKLTERADDAWSAYEQNAQYSNYQDYTANIPYQQSANDFGSDNAANGLQIAGLVCGILAICSCCCYGVPALIFGIAGLICAVMGNKRSKNGVGTAGMVCSIIGLILGAIAIVYYAMVINQLIQMNYFDMLQDMM